MYKLEPPQELEHGEARTFSFDGNASHSWKFRLKHFDFYLAVK